MSWFASASAAHDPSAALLARTRRRLLLWTAISTLAVLVLLGGALYAATAVCLQNAAVAQLQARADVLQNVFVSRTFLAPPTGAFEAPIVVGGAQQIGVAVGGPASGTIAVLVGPDGTVLPPGIPAELIDHEGIAEVRVTRPLRAVSDDEIEAAEGEKHAQPSKRRHPFVSG